MFIQVIQGKVKDEEKLRECMDQWVKDLMPGARGFLGSTAGAADDGTFVMMARFDSEESARANSDRPEQGEWWAECEPCFDGKPTFMDCPTVAQWMHGGSDRAGFVQIMEGRTTDMSRMMSLMDQVTDQLHEMRPEIIGGTVASYGTKGDYVEAVYFTDEATARAHEKMEVPDDLRSLYEEEMRLAGDIRYLDLHHPMLISP
jgi:hypothetical protein